MAFNPQEILRGIPQPPVLAIGEEQWAVKLLRRLLAQQGIAPGEWLDPQQQVGAEFDDELRIMLQAFQLRSGIPASGKTDSDTWQALLAEPPLPSLHPRGSRARISARIVEVAEAAAARQVIEQGDNRGATVEMLLRHAGGQPGMPWCVAFAWAVVDLAYFLEQCEPPAIPQSARLSSSALVHWAGDTGRLLEVSADAHPGDLLVLRGGPTGYRHTAVIVAPVDNGSVETVEGNATAFRGSPVDGIVRLQRTLSNGTCVVLRMA